MPRCVLSIWEMSNQLSGKFVNADAFEVVELLSREIKDKPATDNRDVEATAVEYLSMHGWPPIVACERQQRLRLLVHDSEENRNYVHAGAPRKGWISKPGANRRRSEERR